jgi:hypothetical protein
VTSTAAKPGDSGPIGNRWEVIVPLTDGTSHLVSVVNSVATDYADVRQARTVGINVVNGITNSVVFTVEGSLDGENFSTVAYGTGSNSAYLQTAATIAHDDTAILFLPNGDLLRYVRVNPSAANALGTTFTVYGAG